MSDVRNLVRERLEHTDASVPTRAALAFRYQLAGEDVPLEFDTAQPTGWTLRVRPVGPNRAQRRAAARAARRMTR